MIIKGKCVVSIHFKLTDDNGQLLEATPDWEPVVFLNDSFGLLPGLEKGLQGHKVGDALTITVQPEDGYGVSDPSLIHTVPLAAFSEVGPLEIGMQFELESEEGHGEQFTVTSIDGDDVTVDANHPLAGKVLHFDVQVDDIRKATSKEIEMGNVFESTT